ncbi:uncharacterized protein LOC125219161 isoform X1 [Salvia hispanica]|uniref:uncharacterized protein LOC125219161 isoform X1 n=1 Tax=Salvia hispanica TaxID=49212 RepID=UPI002009D405|nr:uncharacterized protein LOC125219161 isoform X1 [Salvia hispanica]XP_047977014.1 uncharacterized protein LOC125219161 isoform X1 [Salvia hispanica]
MEVFGPHNTSSCLYIASSGCSSTDPDHLAQKNSKDLSMNDLKTCLTEFFSVEDIGSSTNELNLSPGKDYVVNVVKECECQGLERIHTDHSASEKCLSKCASGPKPSVDAIIGEKEEQEGDIRAEVSEVNDFNNPSNKCYPQSKSLPLPLKLVSAMKGTREKQGMPPKRLSVTWAPEVYDPVPTSVSHLPSNKNLNYRSNSKKYGKYKQKSGSKSSRGSKSKDKKQVRKSGGGSTKLRPFFETYGDSIGEPHVDFDVSTPDPFCGSSFLKQSVSMHFPVAEAT